MTAQFDMMNLNSFLMFTVFTMDMDEERLTK